jgi:hypothetical protein
VICGAGSDGADGSYPWANPSRIAKADGSTTDCTFGVQTGTVTSNSLIATKFGFTIPVDATKIVIANVFVGSPGGSPANTVTTEAYATLDGSSTTGVSGTNSGLWHNTSFGISGVGSDLVLTPADVNASTFGIILKCSVTNPVTFDGAIISIDDIKVTVCYFD